MVCSRSERNFFLHSAEEIIDAFLEENPDATPEEWVLSLGTPEQFLAQLVDGCEKATVVCNSTYIHFLLFIGINIMLCFALVFASMTAYFFWKMQRYTKIETTKYVYVSDIPTEFPYNSESYHNGGALTYEENN